MPFDEQRQSGPPTGLDPAKPIVVLCLTARVPAVSMMAVKFEGGVMTPKTETQYQRLEPRPGSNDRQLFFKGRRIRAAIVEEAIHGPDPTLFTAGETQAPRVAGA